MIVELFAAVVLSLTASKALLHLEHCGKTPRLPVVVYDDHIWRSNKYGSKRHVGISGSSIKCYLTTHTRNITCWQRCKTNT